VAIISGLFLLVYAAAALRIIRARGGGETARALLLLFCCCMHAYVIAVSSIIEFGENNRFRFPIDGLFIVMAAGAVRFFADLKHRRPTS
jgi:hypothetical protein